MEEKFKKYIILWFSQSISGLGSSMTGFALVLWAYQQSRSAMSVMFLFTGICGFMVSAVSCFNCEIKKLNHLE